MGHQYNLCYTISMKTAISIPDPLYKEADEAAKKLNISRSELYQKALEKFVKEFNEEHLVRELNQTYGVQKAKLDPAIEEMQANTILSETQDDSW